MEEPTFLLTLLFWSICGLGLIAVLPLRKEKNGKWHLFPLISLFLFILYEALMPNKYNIRADLLILVPVVLICLISPIIKIFIIAKRNKQQY